MRRAFSYKRFSSPKQARGDSIRRQTEFEQRIVKEIDLLLDDTLDLSDTGVSAFHGKNAKFGALSQFMKLVEADRKGKDGRPALDDGNLFTGLVWHAGDRVKMSMKSHNGAKKRTPYLMSNLVYKGKPAGEGRTFPYERFEAAVLAALPELRAEDLADRFREPRADWGACVEKLTGDLMVIDERYRGFEQLALDPDNKIPADALSDLLGKLAARRQAIVDDLNLLRAEVTSCRAGAPCDAKTLLGMMQEAAPGAERALYRRKVRTRLRWLIESIWVHIEKVNHVRQFAHVQVFMRTGTRHDLIVESFDAKSGRHNVQPGRDYRDVDFRTHAPAASCERPKLGAQPAALPGSLLSASS